MLAAIHLVILLLLSLSFAKEDYYKVLNVSPSATKQEIRKSFKILALDLHPDKNQDDAETNEKFLLVNKAYEVLKDDELRKNYDLYGEEQVKVKTDTDYHSWSFYEKNFGLFDEDSNIITLNHVEFEQIVLKSKNVWFINFYSTRCASCRHSATAWRELAKELQGVIQIAAVNCMDEWHLCTKENIKSFPSLVLYPMKKMYVGDYDSKDMVDFVLDHLHVDIMEIHENNWKSFTTDADLYKGWPWVIFICDSVYSCFDDNDILRVAAMLENVVKVGTLSCVSDIKQCEEFGARNGVFYWEPHQYAERALHAFVSSLSPKEIYNAVIQYQPEIPEFSDLKLKSTRMHLITADVKPVLIYFYLGKAEDEFELRKLRAYLRNEISIGKMSCARNIKVCADLSVSHYPLLLMFKHNSVHEVYHGRPSAHDIAIFARDSSSATNLRTLNAEDFHDFVEYQGDPDNAWFIDFYVPWCPPCLQFIPILRKASRHLGSTINFGIVDCTVQQDLCRRQNIKSYPTSILFNHTDRITFTGSRDVSSVTSFIEDMLNPEVIVLTKTNFEERIASKPPGELWIIDYFVPWCSVCNELTGEWRKLAKLVSGVDNVHIAEVDCSKNMDLCNAQGIQSYPSIWLYPYSSRGLSTLAIYSGKARTAQNLYQWLFNFMPPIVEELNSVRFSEQVLQDKNAWLIDFYAPWCGHCYNFAPEFYLVAQKLQNKVKAGKVNCDIHTALCNQAGVMGYPSVMLYYGMNKSYQGHEIRSQKKEDITNSVNSILFNQDFDIPTIVHDEF